MPLTFESFAASVDARNEPDAALSAELRALWLAKKGCWEEAHNIAQDIPTRMGSWIHAHLHLLEGDEANAHYWYNRAAQNPSRKSDIAQEWETISRAAIAAGDIS